MAYRIPIPENKELFIQLWNSGVSKREIAAQMDIKQKDINSIRLRLGLKPRKEGVRLGKSAKIDIETLREKIKERKYGNSTVIASEACVTPATVLQWRWRMKREPAMNYEIEPETVDKGEDSLFCDTKFLESYFGKKIS